MVGVHPAASRAMALSPGGYKMARAGVDAVETDRCLPGSQFRLDHPLPPSRAATPWHRTRLRYEPFAAHQLLQVARVRGRSGCAPGEHDGLGLGLRARGFPGGESFLKFHGIWNVGHQMRAFDLSDQQEYFHKIGWIHSPAESKGGRPANLSHPIIYVVNPSSPRAELAAYLVALASQPIPNTDHALGTFHTPDQQRTDGDAGIRGKGLGAAGGHPDARVLGLHAEPWYPSGSEHSSERSGCCPA